MMMAHGIVGYAGGGRAAMAKVTLLLFLAASGAVPAPAGAGEGNRETGAARQTPEQAPIRFGVMLPESGHLRIVAETMRIGARCAVATLNDGGGVNGRRIELVDSPIDFGDAPERLRQAFLDFADRDDILAVIGPCTSRPAVALRDLARERGLVTVAPDATMTGLTTEGGWLFSASSENTLQAAVAAKYLVEGSAVRRTGVLYNASSPYASELAATFTRIYRRMGGEVTRELSFERVEREGGRRAPHNYRDQLAPLIADKPSALYLALDTDDVPALFRQLATLDYDGLTVGSDSWDWEHAYSGSGRRIVGGVFTGGVTDENPDPRLQAIVRRLYDAGARKIDNATCKGYDAALLLAAAVAKGGATREGVRAGWLRIGSIDLSSGSDARVDARGRVFHDISLHEFVEDDRHGMRARFIAGVSARDAFVAYEQAAGGDDSAATSALAP